MSNCWPTSLDVGGGVEAFLGEHGEDLVLVAETPVTDVLSGEIGHGT